MKKILLGFVLTLGFSSAVFAIEAPESAALHHKQCIIDVAQMREQIQQYGSITTQNGSARFTAVSRVAYHHEQCVATGFSYGGYVCDIQWVPSVWGTTFRCDA